MSDNSPTSPQQQVANSLRRERWLARVDRQIDVVLIWYLVREVLKQLSDHDGMKSVVVKFDSDLVRNSTVTRGEVGRHVMYYVQQITGVQADSVTLPDVDNDPDATSRELRCQRNT